MKKYEHRELLGTRDILREEDEIQSNGKIFKKLHLGECLSSCPVQEIRVRPHDLTGSVIQKAKPAAFPSFILSRHLEQCVSGDYRWISYEGADTTSDLFGKGLRSLGLQPKANICIYADTRSEWFLSAIACFQQGGANRTCH